MAEFTSLNPYDSLEFIRAKSPDDLKLQLKKIIQPIKIIAIVPYGLGLVCFFTGDVRVKEKSSKSKEQ